MKTTFRFPEFSPGFDRAFELRVGDAVLPIRTRRPDGTESWELCRNPVVLRHGMSLRGGRRHTGERLAPDGTRTTACGLHRVAAIAWSSRALPTTVPLAVRRKLGGREKMLTVRLAEA